jgi:hypothetical protein
MGPRPRFGREKDRNGNDILDRAGNPVAAHQNTHNENERNIHMAYMASTGKIHASLETPEQRKEIFSRLDKDNAEENE